MMGHEMARSCSMNKAVRAMVPTFFVVPLETPFLSVAGMAITMATVTGNARRI